MAPDAPIGTSLDPRMNRAGLSPAEGFVGAPELDQFQTYQVFHQTRRGEQHVHVGIVHAPNPELALLFAKEQYARRGQAVNLWVVRTADVFATAYDDDDMFTPATDKSYREAHFYKNREVIDEFKRRMDALADRHFRQQQPTQPGALPTDPRRVTVKGHSGKKPTIVIAKKP